MVPARSLIADPTCLEIYQLTIPVDYYMVLTENKTVNTAFYTHEKTFWHSTGVQSLFFPLGEWVEPPEGTYGADTPASKRRFLNLLHVSGLAKNLVFPMIKPATYEDLARVHTRAYLDEFRRVSDAGGGDLGRLAPFSKGGYQVACVSAGLALGAVHDVLSGSGNAYALCRPSGHHCLPDTPISFTLLANIAVAIEAARATHRVSRIAVVDWDVHHANGTQAIYYEDGNVLTISLHQDRCLPPGLSLAASLADARGTGAGQGANINIPLPAGSGHEAYLYAFDRIVIPALYRFKPELIIVASGLDANAVDPLARMLLHSDSYRELTRRMVAAAADLCGGRLVMVHEGGYAEAYVPFCGLAIMETLAGHRTEAVDPALEIFRSWQPDARHNAFLCQIIDEIAAAVLPQRS